MDDKFMHIHNDDKQDYPFCGIKLTVEKLVHYHLVTNQSK